MKFLLLIVAISFPQAISPQNNAIYIYGKTLDSFTWETLKEVRVEAKDEANNVVDSFTTNNMLRISGEEVNFILTLERGKKYKIHFSCNGYEPHTIDFSRTIGRREKYIPVGEVLLKKQKSANEHLLNEVTVKASKVRMVVKGDTIEYNADAFQLAEGSMLDGLMRMLPGFEIENGQIRVNGLYVSSLLVNGNDFFKGDPRIALENLPAYMVNKIKVYRREHDWGYIAQTKNKEELPLVVDVNLKREFSVGWSSNAEAGYGTENRYMARLFGLRFTDCSRLAVYGNANNTNDIREPGTSGDWTSRGVPSGRTSLQTAGVETLVHNKQNTWKYTGNAKCHRQNTDEDTYASAETFLASVANTFSCMHRQGYSRSLRIETAHQLDLKRRLAFSTVTASAAYQHGRNRGDIMRGEFSENPLDGYRGAALDSIFIFGGSDRLTTMLINSSRQRQKDEGDTWRGVAGFTSHIKMPHSKDYVSIRAEVGTEFRDYSTFLDYRLFYNTMASQNDLRYHYGTKPETKVSGNLSLSYYYLDEWGSIQPYVKASERFTDINYNLYRLDKLGEELPMFGALPSTVADLHAIRDIQNSYTSQLNNLNIASGVTMVFYLNKGKSNIQLVPEVQWRNDHLSYRRGTLDTNPTRQAVLFVPSVSYGFDDFRVAYSLSYIDPDLISQQAYTDDADPLNIYKGNSSLRRSTVHRITFLRNYFKKKWASNARIDAYANLMHNAIANGIDYDEVTGVRTHSPRNVNGNWSVGASFDYTNPVDKKKQVVLTNKTSADYHNSVDYVSERSVVRNFNLREQATVNVKWKQSLVTAKVGLRYLNATSPRSTFQTINSFDLTYALTSQHTLPLGFSFATDMTLYQRIGYSDESMNEVRFVMNARFGKSFLKQRLSLTLDAFDIFHGLSTVTKVLNAQGSVETWNNSLPSYFILRAGYRLSKEPKRQRPII